MSDIYDYADISKQTKQHLINNFNEDPSRVNEHIENLRTWIRSMPHLTSPTDCKFLLRFLRVAKFDMKRAQQLLDNFCTIRCSKKGSSEYFNRKIIDGALIDEFLDSGIIVPLGTNEDEELLILIMAKNWNPDKMSREKWQTLAYMLYDVVMNDKADIHGVRFFVDLAGASKKVAKAWSDGDYIKHVESVLQDGYPWRYRGMIFHNAPKVFNPFYQMWSFYKNEDVENCFIPLNKDAKNEIDNISGLRNLLPTECGGLGGPLKSITEKWKPRFKAYYANGDPLACVGVDESKRHPETSDYYNDYPKYHGPCYDTDCSDG